MDRIHYSVNSLSLWEKVGVRELLEHNFSGQNKLCSKESAVCLPSANLFV